MQTSLAVARDRIVGILLRLFMMWIVFDQLWGLPQSGAEARGHLHVSAAGAARARALDDGDACGGRSHSCIASDDQRLVRWDASACRWRLAQARQHR